MGLEQIIRLSLSDEDHWHVIAADSRYGTPLYIAGLYQLPNVTGVTRLGSGYILTDNTPNGILSPKLAQEERHYDPERYHA